MNEVLLVWGQFVVCAAVIGFAGSKLSRYGDVIADKTGLSGSWIGLILLSTVTSLPELITGLSSVTVAHVPNIAVGDVLGSCVFNLMILVVLDFLYREEPVYRRAHQGHILSAGFGIIMIGFAGLNLLLSEKGIGLTVGHVGAYSLVLIVLYLIAVRAVFVYERSQLEAFAGVVSERYPGLTYRQAVIRYALAALLVIGASLWLPFVGSELAKVMGWHKTFVGTLFVAGSTSLPELAVTMAAFRIGALDMAIANLLGSNLFNIFVLALDDFFFLEGALLSHVSPLHTMSALSALVMTGIVVVGLLYRPATRILKTVGWVSLALFTVYLLNSYILYLQGE